MKKYNPLNLLMKWGHKISISKNGISGPQKPPLTGTITNPFKMYLSLTLSIEISLESTTFKSGRKSVVQIYKHSACSIITHTIKSPFIKGKER